MSDFLARHGELAVWFYWIGMAIVISLPLGALSVILHRAGRRGIWPSFPWALAMLCGPIYGMLIWLFQGEGYFQLGYILGLVAGWASGAGISIGISLVLFAIIGIGPAHPPPPEA
ncbi:MAG: hypothetical protein Q7T61_03935 [Caulobacter sp.]|nr:hypothetical protein [Caulobacter sp.]